MLRFLPVAVLLALVLGWLLWKGKASRSKEEVAEYIERFIKGTGDYRDWDEFTSVAIKDPYLDRIRARCLEDTTNPRALQEILEELRRGAA